MGMNENLLWITLMWTHTHIHTKHRYNVGIVGCRVHSTRSTSHWIRLFVKSIENAFILYRYILHWTAILNKTKQSKKMYKVTVSFHWKLLPSLAYELQITWPFLPFFSFFFFIELDTILREFQIQSKFRRKMKLCLRFSHCDDREQPYVSTLNQTENNTITYTDK